jgi:hypothetical protein
MFMRLRAACPAESDFCSWHYPEAFEGANEFRSLRCCGPVLLTASSSLHRRKIDFPTFRNLAGKTIDHGVILKVVTTRLPKPVQRVDCELA